MWAYLETGSLRRLPGYIIVIGGGGLTEYDWCPYGKGKMWTHRHAERQKMIRRDREKMDIYEPQRGLEWIPPCIPRKDPPCCQLGPGLAAPRTVRQHISGVEAPAGWYVVTAALANQRTRI